MGYFNFLSVQASVVSGYSLEIEQGGYSLHDAHNVSNLEFCNYSAIYTHPGWDDQLNFQVWLPLDDTWNSRLQAAGGGGYRTGLLEPHLAGAVNDGYAVVSTDGGHWNESAPSEWALKSDGNLNWPLLEDFASRAWLEAVDFGKQVTESFYGRPPEYSYWNGCSTGGRQGLMLAQQYPEASDGILAAAPAVNWADFLVTGYYPKFVMNQLGQYPQPCELEVLRQAALSACDTLDGVEDGIISAFRQCDFDPHTLVGTTLSCPKNGQDITVSSAAATVAEACWEGAKFADGSFMWYPLGHDAPLSSIANTTCEPAREEGSTANCTGVPFGHSANWLQYFVFADPGRDLTTLSPGEYDAAFRKSKQKFTSTISANDPDLGPFRDAGGKMITWHGLADAVIFPDGTKQYYEAVEAGDGNVRDYYRYFEAPGVEHCRGGVGPYPGTVMQALVDWVEKGDAPETIVATSLPNDDGQVWVRPLCLYPLVARYTGDGNPRVAENWECAETYE